MRWLIVEDSLESRKGHWLEYLKGFHQELQRLGDDVICLIPKNVDPDVRESFGALPMLPDSPFNRMSDGSPAWRRYARVPAHAWKTFWTVRRFFEESSEAEIIFVPTVTIHHLLSWFCLIKTMRRHPSARALLFFPTLPVRRQESAATLDGSPTSRLMRFLLRRLTKEIRVGKVVLGVETEAMRQAGEKAFGVAFTYFPHPVQPYKEEKPETLRTGTPNAKRPTPNSGPLLFACYGLARHEKGSDVLVAAIETYLRRFSDSEVKFAVQWLDDFVLPDGKMAALPPVLKHHPQVEIVRRLFGDGEYVRRLNQSSALLLPYRQSSYGLRVSRVAIEAMVNGIPVVATHSTTLVEQAKKFGAAVLCEDGNVESLVEAIREMEQNFPRVKEQAERQKVAARREFSVEEFRRELLR